MDMLIRSGEPSKYDQFPYGTVCKMVKTMGDTFEVFVQISEDESSPRWERVGIFTHDTENSIESEVQKVLQRKTP